MLRLLIISVTIAASVLAYPRSLAQSKGHKPVPKCLQDVHLNVYYDSRSNGTEPFISKQLSPVAHKLLKWLHITLIPYGLAKIGKDGKAACNHGAKECLMSRIQVCSFKRMKGTGPAVYLSRVELAQCLMKDFKEDIFTIGKRCTHKKQLDWNAIKNCATGKEGHELEKKYIEEARKIGVPQVPFVALNKQFGTKEYQRLAVSNLQAMAEKVHNCNNPLANVTCPTTRKTPSSWASASLPCDQLLAGYQVEDLHILKLVPIKKRNGVRKF